MTEETTDIVKPTDQPLMDFSGGMALVSVEEQNIILEEYDKRRQNFREWLLSHLKEGVHYGYPPGCEVKRDADGNLVQQYKDKRSGQWMTRVVSKRQWVPKPSLYKAGARLIVDLLPMRDSYRSDRDAWEMAGSPVGTLFRTCTLLHATTGNSLGEGTGAFRGPVGTRAGEKGMNENSAIKMADKRALVAAVVNTIPVVADLFTQDMEDKEDPARRPPADGRPKAHIDDESGRPSQRAISAFWERVQDKRKERDSSMTNAEFIEAICQDFAGVDGLKKLTVDQFRDLGQALAADSYDWSNGQRVAEPADGTEADNA